MFSFCRTVLHYMYALMQSNLLETHACSNSVSTASSVPDMTFSRKLAITTLTAKFPAELRLSPELTN